MRLIGEQLACERSGRTVFRDLSFSLAPGEALAVTGPNGAGKSTLLRLVAGLLRPSAGRILLEDDLPEALPSERVHYMGHKDALKPALTPVEILEFWAAYLGGGGLNCGEALDAVELGHTADLPSGYMSAGQRRRLSLARLLVARRPLWLLDEPTNALDAGSQDTLRRLCAEHLAGGGLIMLATHAETGIPTRSLRLGAST
jgi:heme exporter protein A